MRLFPWAGALWLLGSGCAFLRSGSDPVVARIAGTPLRFSEVQARYLRSAEARVDSAAAFVEFLERYVDYRLKVLEARRQGLDRDPQLAQELREYRQQLARPYLLERAVLEPIMRDLYRKRQEEIRASHVLVRLPNPQDTLEAWRRIQALRDSVLAGRPFAEIARRYSEDPSARQNGGDLGYFTGGRMVREFEEMAYRTPVGGVSPVFRTRFGYHFLMVLDRRPRTPDIRVAHILVRTPQDTIRADTAEARRRIWALYERLQRGEDFATLARLYSDDRASAEQGGELGVIGFGEFPVREFEREAFALHEPGQYSRPFQSPYGWHIVKLLERLPRPSYEEAVAELRELAQRLPQSREEERALIERTWDEADGLFYDDVLARLVEATDTSARVGSWRAQEWPDSLRRAVLMRLDTLAFSAEDLLTYILSRPVFMVWGDPRVRKQLPELAAEFRQEVVLRYLEGQLEKRYPEFGRLMREYEEGLLVFALTEREVWNRAQRDTAALRDWYARHRERYRFPDRVQIIRCTTPDSSLAVEVLKALHAGLAPDSLRARYQRDDVLRLRVETLYVERPVGAPQDEMLFLPDGATSGPHRYGEGWVVLRRERFEPARPKRYEEALAQVISEYQEHLERLWVAHLRRSYGVAVYSDRAHRAFARWAVRRNS
ncbi:MAG: peptidylprolyl isomerase [Bacteroidetes bacterium]|nr:peptidylprolyl isomerase [Rhodothermia bacterium]MCS7154991.1 peptidylprolyl isomerase [Bacteroidota bacterium]MCX7907275.1 peptidylprolyl isomerase [Bacteroidota bacterium]MDW8137999.1 peptidylprolyl isomerase [Bacteroidota bacterium]MDW8286149.1 peptidylprolyl isomerase [Bacteroidota bacterium]